MNTVRLHFDRLENRDVPTTFTWTGLIDDDWGNYQNWSNEKSLTEYPDDSTDVAIFDGSSSNAPAAMGDSYLAIDSLKTVNGYSGTIELHGDLVLQGEDSVLNSPVSIEPQTTETNLEVEGILVVKQGAIGSNTTKSTFVVHGHVDFELTDDVTLGMDLLIEEGGIVYIQNAAGNSGDHVTLHNAANVVVGDSSFLEFRGEDGDGWLLNSGTGSGYMHVDGHLLRVGDREAQIHIPVLLNQSSSFLTVKGGTSPHLKIVANGVAATSFKSLFADDGSTILLGTGEPDSEDEAILSVADDLEVHDSIMSALAPQVSIYADLVEFTGTESLLTLGFENKGTQYYTKLVFHLSGSTTEVRIMDGTTISLDVAAGGDAKSAPKDWIVLDEAIDDGKLVIENDNTTLSITMHGNEQVGETYVLFDADGGITGTFNSVFDFAADFDDGVIDNSHPLFRETYVFTTE